MNSTVSQGRSQEFSKWGGGGVSHSLCQNEGTHQIVISCLPPVVGVFAQKRRAKGGRGHASPVSFIYCIEAA